MLKRTILAAIFLLPAWWSLPASAEPKDVVLVLDNSGSMRVNDPEFLTGVAVRKFIDGLSADTRLALVIFDQDARLTMPLTAVGDDSREAFLSKLGEVNYRGLYTDSAAAIERAVYELKVNGRPGAERSIVFLTDGIVDTGNASMDAEKYSWLRNELAADAADENIRIFGIAFTDGADFLLIQSLSRRTSGEYYRAFTPTDIGDVLSRIVAIIEQPRAPGLETAAAAVGGLPNVEADTSAPPPGSSLELPEAVLLPPADAAAAESAAPASTLALPESITTVPGEVAALPMLPRESPAAPAAETEDAKTESDSPNAPSPVGSAPEFVPGAAGMTHVVAALLALCLLAAVALALRRKSSSKSEPAARIPKAFLSDLDGITEQSGYELSEALTVIGRIKGSDADQINYVVIPESTVGRRHAMIEFKKHGYWIVDQSSLNGTFVNDKRIEGETRLKHGDRIRFHKHEFEFLLLDMFETERTMMSETVFADLARSVDADDGASPVVSQRSH